MAISISRIAGIAAILCAWMASVQAPQAQETGIVVYDAPRESLTKAWADDGLRSGPNHRHKSTP